LVFIKISLLAFMTNLTYSMIAL